MADNWWDNSFSRARPCLDSVSVTNSINLFQDTQTTTGDTTTSTTANTGGDGTRVNTTLPMMELGLPSQSLPQSLDWNQSLFRGDQKGDGGFRNLLQDQDNSLSSNTTHIPLENNLWRPQKMYPASSQDSSSEFKQINVRGFHLDQPVQDSDTESIVTCQGLNSSFQNMDLYGAPSTIMQTLFGSDHNQQQQDSSFEQNQGMSNYSLYQSSYGGLNVPGGSSELSTSNWSKYSSQPQDFVVNSPSKAQLPDMGANQLHFANNARFWNASATGGVNDMRSGFFPSLQMQLPLSSFEDKPKITSKVVKESTSESSSNKRPRNENQSTIQAFKVKKEKMGDRITALQQLVSPFGKTDTASVLSEAIDYIKFLHEHVGVLSTPYMKNGAPILQQQQQQQTPDKPPEGPRQDLRSRGLCLVPVSSTFPVTHETTVDFWTPTFGGTFR
ncbi:transcription factor bHLH123-like [Bidens hawaiensis]|uniref:transcription factor bHLH123-like n=1 Tax=Bidens hawaiensis TaxID=980011 RepID=UPI00404A3FA9